MRYGKLVNGRLLPAPNPLKLGNGEVWDPSAYLWEAVGYRRVVDTQKPEGMPGKYATYWEEQDGEIVRIWKAL